ncbi:hypothetical protein HDU87_003074 [Geranomyces variabilis]|uniref:RRM domain-containing protein n=1 Tax=Geranomyces variabilis TaxID=109894 RepID=A0AAD5XSW3_9FUNG|nr:hypothetical protein HDU87_003074 [Geranomyces variabilis]
MTDGKATSNAVNHSSCASTGAAKSAHPQQQPPPSSASTSTSTSTRLYIGNLPPSLTEYHLAALFSPFGALTKIDYLWHKHGPHRGEPRGYCFIEYADARSACKAVAAFSEDKGNHPGLLRGGRPRLVVRFSVETGAGDDEGGFAEKIGSSVGGAGVSSTAGGGGGGRAPAPTTTITRKRTKGAMDVARNNRDTQEPVNAKLQPRVGHISMDSKISAIERKLLQLQSSSSQPSSSSAASPPTRATGSGGGTGAPSGNIARHSSQRATTHVRHKPYDKR